MRQFLSYGPEMEPLDLEPLNIIIGPNGSGKTNLIEALSLLRATPTDLTTPIRDGGGVSEWLWKGSERSTAEINVVVHNPQGRRPLRHRISFTVSGHRLELIDEAIEDAGAGKPDASDVHFYYRYQHGKPVLNVRRITEGTTRPDERMERQLRREELELDQSVLAQRKDPDLYPEITYLSRQYTRMRIYREWNLGRYTPPRLPQKADLPEDFLLEDSANLGLVLNDMENRSGTFRTLMENLRKVYEGIENITFQIRAGTVQIFLHEAGLRQSIPATRLSDGTLRYLCLLAVLCHPEPPPLICIEEPELGLHPDTLATIAELLVDASKRTQLVVTTRSDVLISALSENPESVIVCSHDGEGSHLKRIELARVEKLLQDQTLGDLWRMGAIGGNRW